MRDINAIAPAVNAAGLASSATTELIRFAREGNGLPHHPFGVSDPTVELAQAIIIAAEIERDGVVANTDGQDRSDEIGMLFQLVTACRKFVSDWSGGLG